MSFEQPPSAKREHFNNNSLHFKRPRTRWLYFKYYLSGQNRFK